MIPIFTHREFPPRQQFLAAAIVVVLVASGCSQVQSPNAATRPQSTTTLSPTTTAAETTGADESPTTTAADNTDQQTTSSQNAGSDPTVPDTGELLGELEFSVVGRFPHDPAAFTQGLAFDQGDLVESVGLYGESGVRRYTPGSPPSAVEALDDEFFGAGIAIVGDQALQLTWQEGRAISRQVDNLVPLESIGYSGEGWGLCFDGERLIMSNGSTNLTFRDPSSFEVLGTVEVTRNGQVVPRLNELECVEGFVWANVWLSNEILRIDPNSGEVVAWLDASSLEPSGLSQDDVLNGIAYSPQTNTYFLTGKRWPQLFEVSIGAP